MLPVRRSVRSFLRLNTQPEEIQDLSYIGYEGTMFNGAESTVRRASLNSGYPLRAFDCNLISSLGIQGHLGAAAEIPCIFLRRGEASP